MSICENENCKKETVVIYITEEGRLCSECNDRLEKRKKAGKVILRKKKKAREVVLRKRKV